MSEQIWSNSQVIDWSQILLDSYSKLLGRELIARNNSQTEQAKALFNAPFVLVSHGNQKDPILNYGNLAALELWEMNWSDFTKTPSRLTAAPEFQEDRQLLLNLAAKQGFVENYTGVRVSSTGKLFKVEKVTMWNLVNMENKPCGQAATFPIPKPTL